MSTESPQLPLDTAEAPAKAKQSPARVCSACKHWQKSTMRSSALSAVAGVCKRTPPLADFRWPRTYENDSCGEWRAK